MESQGIDIIDRERKLCWIVVIEFQADTKICNKKEKKDREVLKISLEIHQLLMINKKL